MRQELRCLQSRDSGKTEIGGQKMRVILQALRGVVDREQAPVEQERF